MIANVKYNDQIPVPKIIYKSIHCKVNLAKGKLYSINWLDAFITSDAHHEHDRHATMHIGRDSALFLVPFSTPVAKFSNCTLVGSRYSPHEKKTAKFHEVSETFRSSLESDRCQRRKQVQTSC